LDDRILHRPRNAQLYGFRACGNYPDTGGLQDGKGRSFLEGGFGKDGGQRTAAMKCGAVKLKTAEGKWLEAGGKKWWKLHYLENSVAITEFSR
jgi:hypothetical protein